MSEAGRRAVITGIGLVTPVGSSPARVFDALCAGESGLRKPPDDHPVAGVLKVAGIAQEIDQADVLPATEVRAVDRYIVMALAAADSALADAGVGSPGTELEFAL